MTPTEFRTIRKSLGLSQNEMAKALRLNSGRAVRAYEGGEREISGPISLLMECFAIGDFLHPDGRDLKLP